MARQSFNKRPFTTVQHITLLRQRGLLVPNQNEAEQYLSNISYYRLSAYMIPFQQVKDRFNHNTEFMNIVDLYVFDRELRLLVLDAIERIEVAVRAQIVNQLCNKYGSHWQDDRAVFIRNSRAYPGLQQIINEHCNSRNPEVFISHYLGNYHTPTNPPAWMCLELLTIGQLSKLFADIGLNQDKTDISNYFHLHRSVFQSWVHTLTYVRNICAHHARLWNRDFAIQPILLLRPMLNWIQPSYNNNRRCFYFLCTLQYLLQTVNPTGHFNEKVGTLIKKHPSVPIQFMGFIQGWENEPLWQ
jgi:abortive infection bacteriophage resistance protein